MYCSVYSSYLYSPDFPGFALHLTAIISIPCHILAFYCVIFKTPDNMKSIKTSLIILCVWTVILDLQITVLSTPFVMFPIVAGYPIGYLSYLGVNIPIQVALTLSALVGCTTSLACLFANRYNLITLKNSKYYEVYLYGFNGILAGGLICNCLLKIPEQSHAVPLVFQKLTCLSSEVQSMPIFVVSSEGSLVEYSIGVYSLVTFVEYLYFFIATAYYLKFNITSGMSSRTQNLQKSFFFSVALQILIPICVLFIPWSYAIYACLFDYYNQALNNLLAFDMGLHGIVSSISMILIHKPYRQTIFRTESDVKPLADVRSFGGIKMIFRKTNIIQRQISIPL